MIPLRSFIGTCILMLLAILLAATAALTPLQAKAQATGAKPGSGAVVDARTPPPDDPPPDPPFNAGGFVSQSVPTTMTAGQSYIVTVTMINTGTKDWTTATGHKLGSANPNDNGTWGGSRVPLASNVFHGQNAEFNFQVTAPSTPGSYNFQWQMLQEGVEWFGFPSNNVVVNVVPPPRVNGAMLIGQNVPSQMTSGQSYSVTIVMQNTGNRTWTSADQYSLGLPTVNGQQLWNGGRVPLPGDVPPGGQVTFNFNVTAPAPGSYSFWSLMVQDGVEWFGQGSNAPVTVNAPPTNGAAFVSMNVPPLTQGQQATISVTMQNTGNTTWPAGSNYKLGSKNPDENLIWGVQRVDLANDVAPGQQYTFTFPITAPAAGTYMMQWEMMQRYVQWFGGLASGSVTVSPPAPVDNVTYIHTDALGSPVARSDSAGNIISRASYEPYGRTGGGVTPTIGFTGHVNDADTGLVYMQQRYYDPVIGRFLSVDPVVTDLNAGESFNRYRYASNNPYRYIDPDGRMDEATCAKMGKLFCTQGTASSGSKDDPDPPAVAKKSQPNGPIITGSAYIDEASTELNAMALLAMSAAGDGRGPVYGTKVHTIFAELGKR